MLLLLLLLSRFSVSNSVRPNRWQPTRLPCSWDSPGKNTGMGCHFLLQSMKVRVKSHCRVRLLVTPRTTAYQAPRSMGFSRQEYWSGLPFPSPGDLLTQGLKPGLLHCRRKWQPTPVFLPGESQEQGSLVGCHLWGQTESDTTEVT